MKIELDFSDDDLDDISQLALLLEMSHPSGSIEARVGRMLWDAVKVKTSDSSKKRGSKELQMDRKEASRLASDIADAVESMTHVMANEPTASQQVRKHLHDCLQDAVATALVESSKTS